jgi:hypothetical protein
MTSKLILTVTTELKIVYPNSRKLGIAANAALPAITQNSLKVIMRVKVKLILEQAKELYSFLNLGARWVRVVKVTPRPLYNWERPGTHCIGGWVGSRAGLDGCGKSRPPPGFDPRTVQPVASRYTIMRVVR